MAKQNWTIEWRIVCASFGKNGHHGHASNRSDGESARRARKVADKDCQAVDYRHACLPWRVESRLVGPWRAPEENDAASSLLGQLLE